MHDPQSLTLEIALQDPGLSMGVFEEGGAASTLKHYSHCRINHREILQLCGEINSVLHKACLRGGATEPDSLAALKKAGQLLWDQMLSRPVKERLKGAAQADLALSLDEELISIPWELLYDGSDFLSLKFNLGRTVRTRDAGQPPRYRSAHARPKMLLLVNPTGDLISSYREGLQIRKKFDAWRRQIGIDFKSTDIDTVYVKKNLCDYDIVHFAGHCEYDETSPQESGWLLSNGRFTAGDILALGDSACLPLLVFSNACHSAQVPEGAFDTAYQKKAYSLACAFLFSGVRLYIGTAWKAEDKVSLAFAQEFYGHLVRGRKIGECMRLSRLKLAKEKWPSSLAWANYLLYGDPNFSFFPGPAKPVAQKKEKKPTFWRPAFAGALLFLFIFTGAYYLYKTLPVFNPAVYLSFSQSGKLFSAGKNQEAILLCLEILRKEPYFLAVYPRLAEAYYRLGDRASALKYYFDYASASDKRQDKKALARAYLGIGWLYHLGGDYLRAEEFYRKALSAARENNDRLNEAVALRKQAVWHIDKGEHSAAMDLLMKSSEINRQRQAGDDYRYNLACDYFDIGLVFTDKNDFSAAREFYQKSRDLFKSLKLKSELSDYYFNLGEVYLFEKEFGKAQECYLRGIKIDRQQGNLPSLAADYNMLGELYTETGNFSAAEDAFFQAEEIAGRIDAPVELRNVYSGLGELYKRKKDFVKSKEYFSKAQEAGPRINQ